MFFSRTVTDAFFVAFRLPNMFRRLLGEGSLSVSFIPVYVEQLSNVDEAQGQKRAKDLASAVLTLLTVTTCALSAIGIVFMKPFLSWLVSGEGYAHVEGKLDLTVLLAQIMFSYLFLVTLFAYFSAILQSHKKFFIPGLAPAAFNFVLILFALIPDRLSPLPGQFLAWGVMVGGIAQAAMVAVLLYKMGRLPRLTLKINVPGSWLVIRNMIPGMIGTGILQLMSIANVNFASRLPEGAHSYIYLGDRILELPQSLIGISLGTAVLPSLSQLWSLGKKQQMVEAAQHHMRLLMFLCLPSALGMYLLARPIVDVLFLRGQFGVRDAQAVTQVIEIYSLLLVASSLVRVAVPSFYAIKNTWLPAVISAICLVVHLFVANIWVDTYGLKGLVGSTALAAVLNLLLVFVLFRYLIGPIGLGKMARSIVHAMPGLLAMSLVVVGVYHGTMQSLGSFLPRSPTQTTALFLAVALGAIAYLWINKLVRHPDIDEVLTLLKRRRRKA